MDRHRHVLSLPVYKLHKKPDTVYCCKSTFIADNGYLLLTALGSLTADPCSDPSTDHKKQHMSKKIALE